jgi:hypothetical protein
MQLLSRIQRRQQRPVDFIEVGFGNNLWAKQKEIVNSVRDYKYTAVRSCHDIGKSFIAARIVLWFIYAFPRSKVISTAPTFRQVQDILWREIREAKMKAKITLHGVVNQTELDIDEEHFAIGLSTNDPSRFQGFHAQYILLIIDEAAGVKNDIYDASEGIVSSQNAKVLYIGNPTSTEGMFYQAFKTPDIHKIHISAFDTPNFTEFGITPKDIATDTWKAKITHNLPRPYLITPEWVRDKWVRWGEDSPMYYSRVLGDFPLQSSDMLIPLGLIEQAALREILPAEGDPEQIGADIARFGSDKTEFLYRKGGKVIEIQEHTHMDTMEVSARLFDFSRFHPYAKLCVDVVGIGAGVVDRLRQLEEKREVFDINVGLPARDSERFFNLRAELYWGLRDRFFEGSIQIPDDEELKAELANIKFSYTPKGQIKLESKEEMKMRGVGSPDKADALALAFGNVASAPSIMDFTKLMAEEAKKGNLI